MAATRTRRRLDCPAAKQFIFGKLATEFFGFAAQRITRRRVDARIDVRARLASGLGFGGSFEALQLCSGDSVLALVCDHGRSFRLMVTMPFITPVVLSCWK
jgi:hypothetical protein